MLLNELFDFHTEIHWKSVNSGFRGYFKIDEDPYVLHIDEYDFKFETSGKICSFIDIGFASIDKDGRESWVATNLNKNQYKIFSVLIHGTEDKIKQLKPDALLLGVNFKNGDNEKRLSIYGRIAKIYTRDGYGSMQDVNTPNGKYFLVSKKEISDEDYQDIKNFIDKNVKLK